MVRNYLLQNVSPGILVRTVGVTWHFDWHYIFRTFSRSCGSECLGVLSYKQKNPLGCQELCQAACACMSWVQILLKSVHIPDYLNSLVDSLSSCNFQKFRRLCPTADINLCAIPSHLSSPIYRRHIKQQKKFLTSSAWFISSIMFGQYQVFITILSRS